GAVVDAILRDDYLVVVCVRIHGAGSHASAGRATGNHNRVDTHLDKMARERSSEKGARLNFGNEQVVGLRRDLLHEVIASQRHGEESWHLAGEATLVMGTLRG